MLWVPTSAGCWQTVSLQVYIAEWLERFSVQTHDEKLEVPAYFVFLIPRAALQWWPNRAMCALWREGGTILPTGAGWRCVPHLPLHVPHCAACSVCTDQLPAAKATARSVSWLLPILQANLPLQMCIATFTCLAVAPHACLHSDCAAPA